MDAVVYTLCFVFAALVAVLIISLLLKHSNARREREIPKRIWTYWHSVNDIPPFVAKCISSWKQMNPGYEITILDVDRLKELCGVDLRAYKSIDLNAHPRVADYCRLIAVAMYGGFWIDASMLCLEPLEWVREAQRSNGAELVGYAAPHTTNPEYPIPESWFFAAPANSPFVNAWMGEGLTMAAKYPTDVDYVAHIEETTTTDLQDLKKDLPYLAIHLWATVVMQRRRKDGRKYAIHLLDASQGPFKYLHDNGWDQDRAIKALCEDEDMQTGLIKFRGKERKFIEGNQTTCSGGSVHPLVYGLFI